MLTKKQKLEKIKESEKLLKENALVIFTDFTGASVGDLKILRKSISSVEGKFKVFKKRLLNIAFKESGIDFDVGQFDLQLGTFFSNKDIHESASIVYKFFKSVEKKGFKILGAYDIKNKNFFDAETVKRIGQLPSREILLSQLVGMLASPLRMFLHVLNEKNKMVESKS